MIEGRAALKPGCRLSPAGDTLLIPEGALRLEGPSLYILKLCDGTKTVDEIADILVAQFPGASRDLILAESSAFLLKLAERGAVEFL